MISSRRALSFSGALVLGVCLAWGARQRTTAPGPRAVEEEPPAAAGQRAPARPEVRTLYEESTSAYHARLFAEADRVVLVTERGFTVLPASGPPREHALALGPVAAVHGDALVFWRAGSLREISLAGLQERELAALPRPPRYLLASEGRIAWIDTGPERKTVLQTLSGGRVRAVHESAFGISAPALHAGHVYWVAQREGGAWSIGSVGLDGQQESSGETHRGRPPAMLAVGHDGVYYYGGPQRGVRRLTFDLQRETAVASGVVCSPFSVSRRVLCAQVGGLFDVATAGATPRFLASERSGPVTAVAATSERAFWVAESGAGRLVVRSVAFPEP